MDKKKKLNYSIYSTINYLICLKFFNPRIIDYINIMKECIINIFCPLYLKKTALKLADIKSLSNLIKSPIKWSKRNYHRLYLILRSSIPYFFSKPRIKWFDKNIEGFLSFNQAKMLYRTSKKIPRNSIIVEIGAYLGRSTCFIAEAIKNRKITFYSIDTFENQAMSEGLRDTFKEYYKNIFHYRNKVNVIKGFSYDVIRDFKEKKIDLLWLDADHSYESTKKDINDWFPQIERHGLFIFHDYYNRKGDVGVKKAVDEKIKANKLKKVKKIGSLLVTSKIGN